jgi:Na+-driven multidrug efflux pump
LDPIFIYYLDWKVEGAAYATLVSQIIVICIFLYFFIIKKTTYIKLIFKKIKINFLIWKKIFSIGFPGSISLLLMSLGLFFMNSILGTSDDGDAYVAAFNLANRIENFITLTLISISTSQVTIIGMFYGAKRFDLIKPLVRYATFWSMFIAGLFSLVAFFFINDITSLFFDQNEIAFASTVSYYKILAIAFPFIALIMVSTRSIQAIGQAWPMMGITILRVLIIQCGLTYFFIVYLEKPSIEWAWYAISIGCVVSGIIAYLIRLYFLRDKYLEEKF